MGLILDSNVLIAAERGAKPLSDVLAELRAILGSGDIMLSSISVIELEHGVWRAITPQIAAKRRAYLDGIYASIPVEPFTKEIAQLAAKTDAEARMKGLVIPFGDLQIGVTALHFRCAVCTHNVRHFQMIPGLTVQSL